MRMRTSNRGMKRYIWRRIPARRGEHVPNKLYLLTVAVILLSLVIHLTLLFVGSVLVLIILLLVDIEASYALREVHCKIKLSEERVLFGEEATLTISIENAKILPLPILNFTMPVPRALPIKGHPVPKTSLSNYMDLEGMFSMRWYERVTRTYTIQCQNRGIYTYGPTKIQGGDIFGFIDKDGVVEKKLHILVYPLTLPLSSFNLPARHPFGDRRTPRRLIEDPSQVRGLRDYVYGDSLRRIDWKATARALQMQSKLYETTTTYTMAIFLNASMTMDSYYGIHPDLQELAISAAASIAHWGINAGYAVGLYANTAVQLTEDDTAGITGNGERETEDSEIQQKDIATIIANQIASHRVHLSPGSSSEQYQRILDTLARLQTQGITPIEEILFAERHRLPAGSTVIVITNSVNERLTEQLTHLRKNGYAVTILFVGDATIPPRISGITVYALGGEETWEKLCAAASKHSQQEILTSATTVPSFQL